MHGEDDRVIPGHALAMRADKPFSGLQPFGNNFLTKFQGAEIDSPILHNLTLIDSPGVLSGEKQRIGRDYEFTSVVKWRVYEIPSTVGRARGSHTRRWLFRRFAERADMIIVMFDAHKLDISDELKNTIDVLRPHYDKIRVLLNKADTIDAQQLLRVYGALMWQLGKVMRTPEVCRVHLGSFWEQPLQHREQSHLLYREKLDLLQELNALPRNAVLRRINELSKRGRYLKVHCYIIHFLRKQMPYFRKQEKQRALLERLDNQFSMCARRYGLSRGDFPEIAKFRQSLGEVRDISKFPKLDKTLIRDMERMFAHEIPGARPRRRSPEVVAAPTPRGRRACFSIGLSATCDQRRGSSPAGRRASRKIAARPRCGLVGACN